MAYTKQNIFESKFNGYTKSTIGIPDWAQQLINQGETNTSPQTAYAKVPQLYRAVQLRANSLASVPFKLESGKDLIDWPLTTPLPKLLFEMEVSMMIGGAAYVLKQTPNSGGKRTVGLQFMLPNTVTVRYINDKISFIQEIQGRRYGPWDRDRFIFMREFSFSDEIGAGLAPAKVALNATILRLSMQEFASGFFASGAQPMTLLTMSGNPPPSEIERTERFFRRTMQGVRNAWRVLAVRSEVTVQPITPDVNSMALPELQDITTREIAAAFGVPLSLLTSDSANYATAHSDTRLFYEGTIKPRLLLYEQALNTDLLNDMGLHITFIPEALPVYQEDEAERSGALVNLVQAGMQLKDAMFILGYSVEEVTGLQTDVTSEISTSPVSTQVNTVPTPAASKVLSSVITQKKKQFLNTKTQTEKSLQIYADTANLERSASELKAWVKVAQKNKERALSFDCNHLPIELELWIKSQISLTNCNIAHIIEHSFQKSLNLETAAEKAVGRILSRIFSKYGKPLKKYAKFGELDNLGLSELHRSLTEDLEPVLQKIYETQIKLTISETKETIPDASVDTERWTTAAQDWANSYTFNLVKGITDNTRKDIQVMINKLVVNPLMTSKDIDSGLYKTFSAYRVAMIATTEVGRAKAAAINGYAELLTEDDIPVVKRWNTSFDEKVCPICSPMDDKLDDEYKKQFEFGPPAHPNCRCKIGVELKEFEFDPLQDITVSGTDETGGGVGSGRRKKEPAVTGVVAEPSASVSAQPVVDMSKLKLFPLTVDPLAPPPIIPIKVQAVSNKDWLTQELTRYKQRLNADNWVEDNKSLFTAQQILDFRRAQRFNVGVTESEIDSSAEGLYSRTFLPFGAIEDGKYTETYIAERLERFAEIKTRWIESKIREELQSDGITVTEQELMASVERGLAISKRAIDITTDIAVKKMPLLIADAPLIYTMQPEGMLKAFEQDKIKNQLESSIRRSGGLYRPNLRREHDKEAFSITEQSPDAHPISGWLAIDESQADVTQYGSVHIVLKPVLRERTTLTVTDSLNMPVLPVPIKQAEISMSAKEVSSELNNLYNSTVSTTPISIGYPYIETQIHGGIVPSRDIASIIIEQPRVLLHKEVVQREQLRDKTREISEFLANNSSVSPEQYSAPLKETLRQLKEEMEGIEYRLGDTTAAITDAIKQTDKIRAAAALQNIPIIEGVYTNQPFSLYQAESEKINIRKTLGLSERFATTDLTSTAPSGEGYLN